MIGNINYCRAKRSDNGEWVKGYYTYYPLQFGNEVEGTEHCIRNTSTNPNKLYFVDGETICRCTGKEYMDSDIAYEGDIFESQVCGLLMVLRYGTYQAFCPVDREYMDSVGFYAECEGLPNMPIGDLKEYALKRGNIFDNPELLKKEE